jgi:plasmid stabilization system protein ParE
VSRVLRVLPEAEDELLAAAEWYESKRPGLGIEFVATIDEALEDILHAPDRWPIWRKARPYRMRIIHRFPYMVFYTSKKSEVRVIAIAHSKRRPGYWIGRTSP